MQTETSQSYQEVQRQTAVAPSKRQNLSRGRVDLSRYKDNKQKPKVRQRRPLQRHQLLSLFHLFSENDTETQTPPLPNLPEPTLTPPLFSSSLALPPVSTGGVRSPAMESQTKQPLRESGIDLMSLAEEGMRAFEAAQARVDSMGLIAQMMVAHMSNCNGADGHRTVMVSPHLLSEAHDKAITNVLNQRDIAAKISGGTPLTEAEENRLNSIITGTYAKITGLDTSKLKGAGVSLTDRTALLTVIPGLLSHAGCGCHPSQAAVATLSAQYSMGLSLSGAKDHGHDHDTYKCKCGWQTESCSQPKACARCGEKDKKHITKQPKPLLKSRHKH